MARGDFTTVIVVNASQYAVTNRQPSAGVEEEVMDMGTLNFEGSAPDGVPSGQLFIGNGTDNEASAWDGDVGAGATVFGADRVIIITNTNYAQFQQLSGVTSDFTFSIVEVD